MAAMLALSQRLSSGTAPSFAPSKAKSVFFDVAGYFMVSTADPFGHMTPQSHDQTVQPLFHRVAQQPVLPCSAPSGMFTTVCWHTHVWNTELDMLLDAMFKQSCQQ